jgi:hypothetical protein
MQVADVSWSVGQPNGPPGRAKADDLILPGTTAPGSSSHHATLPHSLSFLALRFRAFPLDFRRHSHNSCWPSKSDSCPLHLPPGQLVPNTNFPVFPLLAVDLERSIRTSTPPTRSRPTFTRFQKPFSSDQPFHPPACHLLPATTVTAFCGIDCRHGVRDYRSLSLVFRPPPFSATRAGRSTSLKTARPTSQPGTRPLSNPDRT